MSFVKSLVVLAIALAGCGDNKLQPGLPFHDAGDRDAPSFPPPPPALGAQIDRIGRPAISTTLVAVFAADSSKAAQKDTYNHAADPATWKTTMLQTNVTIERELEVNLAKFDAIDQAGCGNALKYSGPPSPTSYRAAADLFADDQLYVDTSKPTCTVYLDLEIELASAGSFIHRTCGGRMLNHDVIDVSYSVLAAGTDGLNQATEFSPKIGDGVIAHKDTKDTFPFLGPPH
ncbi:MAG TPA: hypothetical protein VHN14_37455 [Kofleriaceae bacterium]|jgi:hypothetical protein|nr:hypothetical protein [Kofleriaceae bacterium]